MTAIPPSTDDDFDLVHGGLANVLSMRLGLSGEQPKRRLRKLLVLLAVTWLPMAVLAVVSGHAYGNAVKIPYFYDPEVHVRLLIAIPLLELGEIIVGLSLRVQARHLIERGIVSHHDLPGYRAARNEAIFMRNSVFSEATIFLLAYALAILSRLVLGMTEGVSSWERVNDVITPAGWWQILVSLPMLYFFLLRWVFVLIVWSRFLYCISQLQLELTPTHPDRAGGLGFLGWGLASFSTVLMATSAVFSAGFGSEILHHGESLNSLKFHVIAFVVIALLIVHAPLVVFSDQLARCRFKGLLDFGALAWRHDRAFEKKWLSPDPHRDDETILGSSDVQSMADVAACYEHIDSMRLLPFDVKAFAVLAVATLVPMLPLVATAIPLGDIFTKLAELLV
jgi:hypothetical protein